MSGTATAPPLPAPAAATARARRGAAPRTAAPSTATCTSRRPTRATWLSWPRSCRTPPRPSISSWPPRSARPPPTSRRTAVADVRERLSPAPRTAITGFATRLDDHVGTLRLALGRWSRRADPEPDAEGRRAAGTPLPLSTPCSTSSTRRKALVTEIRASDDGAVRRADAARPAAGRGDVPDGPRRGTTTAGCTADPPGRQAAGSPQPQVASPATRSSSRPPYGEPPMAGRCRRPKRITETSDYVAMMTRISAAYRRPGGGRPGRAGPPARPPGRARRPGEPGHLRGQPLERPLLPERDRADLRRQPPGGREADRARRGRLRADAGGAGRGRAGRIGEVRARRAELLAAAEVEDRTGSPLELRAK